MSGYKATLVDINSKELFIIHLPSVLTGLVEAVMILMIHMVEHVFQIK